MHAPNKNSQTGPLDASSPTCRSGGPSAVSVTGANSGDDPLLDTHLSLRSELKFDSRIENRAPFVVIEDPVRSKYFQIGAREYRFIASIDGKRTPRQIIASLNQSMDESDCPFDEESARTICQWLMQCNLVFSEGIDNAKRLNQQAGAIRRARLISILNPISFKFKLFNPNQALKAIQPYSQWLFSTWFFVLWCTVALYALSQMYVHWDQMGTASAGILSGFGWLWLLLLWAALKVVHEAAHGIACRRYGGEVPEAGVLLLLFTPMAYVNVTSMWRFSNRWQRMVVAAAGMYVELFISFLSLITWTQTSGLIADIAFNVFIMSSITTILFNANPLMRFDGYFLLSDLMCIPNLYTKGTKWFGDRLVSLFFGLPKTPNLCSEHELRRVAVYGCLAYFWKISISISLIIGAGVLFHGAGLVLSGIGVAMWFGLPMYKQIRLIFGPMAKHPVRPIRVAASCVTVALLGIMLFSVLKAPATKSSPAIVQFADETVVRAKVNGFVEQLLVQDGDQVQQGQVLLKLSNPELVNAVLELERLADESLTQSRIYKQQNELSQAMAEIKKYEELNAQLAEKREEATGLSIVAPLDGFVFQRNLGNQLGNFAERGDAILTIGQRQTKEIVVSIDESDLSSVEGNEGELLRVAIPGLRIFESRLARVNPRASDIPSHPSLCAHAGGPLPVQPIVGDPNSDTDSSLELVSPRFNVILELDPETSNQLHSGQRGRAFYSTCEQSLGSYFYLAAQDWLERKIELATQSATF